VAEAQSVLLLHAFQVLHLFLQSPPQSTSPSTPSLTPLVHVLGWSHFPELQRPLLQSRPDAQARPYVQSALQAAPQSTSASAPSLMPLVQVAAAIHLPLVQMLLRQSQVVVHPCEQWAAATRVVVLSSQRCQDESAYPSRSPSRNQGAACSA
jgi:hypothetical protein